MLIITSNYTRRCCCCCRPFAHPLARLHRHMTKHSLIAVSGTDKAAEQNGTTPAQMSCWWWWMENIAFEETTIRRNIIVVAGYIVTRLRLNINTSHVMLDTENDESL